MKCPANTTWGSEHPWQANHWDRLWISEWETETGKPTVCWWWQNLLALAPAAFPYVLYFSTSFLLGYLYRLPFLCSIPSAFSYKSHYTLTQCCNHFIYLTSMANLQSPINLKWTSLDSEEARVPRGNKCRLRRTCKIQRKGLSWDLNQESSCYEAIVLTMHYCALIFASSHHFSGHPVTSVWPLLLMRTIYWSLCFTLSVFGDLTL